MSRESSKHKHATKEPQQSKEAARVSDESLSGIEGEFNALLRECDFITKVIRRLTLVGALFLGLLAVLPYLLGLISNIPGMNFLAPVGGNNLLLSGAGLLIVVGVVLDTMRQLEAQLMMRNYEGFIK